METTRCEKQENNQPMRNINNEKIAGGPRMESWIPPRLLSRIPHAAILDPGPDLGSRAESWIPARISRIPHGILDPAPDIITDPACTESWILPRSPHGILDPAPDGIPDPACTESRIPPRIPVPVRNPGSRPGPRIPHGILDLALVPGSRTKFLYVLVFPFLGVGLEGSRRGCISFFFFLYFFGDLVSLWQGFILLLHLSLMLFSSGFQLIVPCFLWGRMWEGASVSC